MIGIDFGNGFCEAAFVDQTGNPAIVLNARGEYRTPSWVYFSPKGDVLVGADAFEQGYIDPQNTAHGFKLLLGTNVSVLGNGRSVSPTNAATALIAKLKEDVERQLNITVTDCVATCPANFQDNSKQALLEAYERNHLKVVRLVPEPTAAGLAYALNVPSEKLKVLVYDFGAGTFDTTILRVDGAQITVLATEGIPKLGGNDLTECLVQRCLDRVQKESGERPTPESDPLFSLDLRQRAEQAKISLGTRKEVPIVLSYKGNQAIEKVVQDEFNAAITPFVQQSLDAVDRVLKSASLTASDIDRLIMVGGTSRLPFIQDRVADHTGLVPKYDVDPEKAVAYGAALACMAELAKQGKTVSLNGCVIPPPDAFCRDVTAHPVGCCVADASGAAKRLKHAVIIPKNTPIPCQRIDEFYLEHESQTQAQVEILQGPPEADRDHCLLIGELRLENLPKEARRTPRIQVEYVIDANGMVTATATDKVSGQQQTVSVDYKRGIKPKDKPAAA